MAQIVCRTGVHTQTCRTGVQNDSIKSVGVGVELLWLKNLGSPILVEHQSVACGFVPGECSNVELSTIRRLSTPFT
jgi:hypothetical protein